MIKVSEIYEGVKYDANFSENGELSFSEFNVLSRRAELNLLRFLTGDIVPNPNLPIPFSTQKNKDYLSFFIERKKFNNNFVKPEDYFQFENLFKVGSFKDVSECDSEEEIEINKCNTNIELVDGDEFVSRCSSYIKGMKPTDGRPIAKLVGNKFEIAPEDIGTIELEYIRYPKFAKVEIKIDSVFNQEVIDDVASIDYEWGDWAQEMLIWFIVNSVSRHTREQALAQVNLANKPQG